MKLGFSTVMYEGTRLRYSEIVGKASMLGYDGIELNFLELPSELKTDEIKESLKKFGISVAAIGTRHMYVTHGLYLASPHKVVREKAFAYMMECIKMAGNLGCSTIQAGWAFQGSRLEAPYDVVWRQAVESLRHVGRLAHGHGVKLVIEFACKENAKLINTMGDAMALLDEVGCENVLVMADTFHIHTEKVPLGETVLKAGDRLAYVHLSDSDRLTPGTGTINFREFINALKGLGYKGYLVMEFNPGTRPDEALRQAIEYTRKLL